jgi:diguanylate cyclase (GGDEF)-like protein
VTLDALIVPLLALLAVLMGAVLAVVLRDKRTESNLRHLAMYDPLTELFNRRAFMELAAREIARARRSGLPFAVLMMDLDHFKRVNDRYGHPTGDRVLAGFAAVLGSCLRTEDLVGRYGGEEFCAFLPGTEEAEARGVAERIRTLTAERNLGELPKPITVSIGVSLCTCTASCDLERAIGRADQALYRAKKSGRNRVAVVPDPGGKELAA